MSQDDPTGPSDTSQPLRSFVYRAQTNEGSTLHGVIEAADGDAARWQLQSLGLRLIELEAAEGKPARGKPVRGDDFIAFNQQLAQLVKAGLPVERGLRLMAGEMKGRLAATLRQVADDMAAGQSLADAFDRQRDRFPSGYARLVEAGVKSGNLADVLANLSRHLELTGRMRGALWRTLAYPIVMIVALLGVLWFMDALVLPAFRELTGELVMRSPQRAYTSLWTMEEVQPEPKWPLLTQLLFWVAAAAPWVLGLLVVGGTALALAWGRLQMRGADHFWIERLLGKLPLVGSVLRYDSLARWCDGVRIAVRSGLDLPASIELAGDVAGSPTLNVDGELLIDTLREGQRLADAPPLARVSPSTVLAMDLGAARGDLPQTMATLSDLYEQQARHRIDVAAAVLQPVMIVVLGIFVGVMIGGLYSVLTHLINSVTY